MKHMDEALAHHPSGILIYHPAGSRPFRMGSLLSVEFVTELIGAFLAVFLLAQTRLTSYGARVGFVTVIGIIVAIATNVSYWNWYGFPANYTAAYMFIQVHRLSLRRPGGGFRFEESEVRPIRADRCNVGGALVPR